MVFKYIFNDITFTICVSNYDLIGCNKCKANKIIVIYFLHMIGAKNKMSLISAVNRKFFNSLYN